jgi:hypothetical protein
MNLMDFDPRSGGTLKCCEAYGGGRRPLGCIESSRMSSLLCNGDTE